MAALIWVVPPVLRWFQRPRDPLDALEEEFEPWWRFLARAAGGIVAWSVAASVVVWAVTLPLVMLRFHLVSPACIVLNVPLVPLTSFALLLAGITLLLGAVWTPLGLPAAWLCNQCLHATDWLVRSGLSWRWGHWFTTGPSPGWVVAVYALLALAVVATAGGWALRKVAWGGVLVLVLLAPAGRAPRGPREAVVLNVGHGLAVVIQTGPGHAVLYDCGKMRDPHVGRRVIAPALWALGVSHLDRVILSHADVDHYNGLDDLLDRFPIGGVLVPAGFAGPPNPGATRLLESVRSRGDSHPGACPRRSAGAGRRPGRDGPPSRAEHAGRAPDNDRSLVLDVADSGRHLLLTGDLDGSGLPELIAGPRRRIDVLVAPHHGGRTANPPWLYDWARPAAVLVSQRAPLPGPGRTRLPGTRGNPAPADASLRGPPVAMVVREIEHPIVPPIANGRAPVGPGRPAAGLHHARRVTPGRLGPRGGCARRLRGRAGRMQRARGRGVRRLGAGAAGRAAPRERAADLGGDPRPRARTACLWRRDGGALRRRPAGRSCCFTASGRTGRRCWVGPRSSWSEAGTSRCSIPGAGAGAETPGPRSGPGRAGTSPSGSTSSAGTVGPGFEPIAWGRSMGAAIALQTAARDHRLKALILEAPYARLHDSIARSLASRRLPAMLAGALLRRAGGIAGCELDHPCPEDAARAVRIPVLILHGSEDRIAPPSEVQRLASALPGPPGVVVVPGAHHGDIFEIGGAELTDRIADFLAGCLDPS